MTQEEKARAYNEALEKAKKLQETCDSQAVVGWCEYLFPELVESEGEKIRKALVEMVHDTTGDSLWIDYNVHKEDALAWLERQGEHANFRNKIQVGDKVTRNEAGVLVNLSQLKRVAKPRKKQGEQNFEMKSAEESLGIDSDTYNKIVDECIFGVQKHVWSGEDEELLKWSINNLTELKDRYGEGYGNVGKCIDWLKSLRPQSQWKPSDEQMDALRYVTNFDYGGYKAMLISLYEQLKKLKG